LGDIFFVNAACPGSAETSMSPAEIFVCWSCAFSQSGY
jgi:hypothetical protein